MTLALNLGKTVADLERDMSGVEFDLWRRYASRNVLPWRKMELHLAQIAHIIAATMGGAKDKSLADYMFDPEEEHHGPISTDDEAAAFFGFSPRAKKVISNG